MSVLKNQRELSKMEFYKNGLALRREMRKWLSSDFGSKPRLKDLQIVEYNISDEDKATIQEILDRNEINHSKAFQRKEPEWNIDEEKKYLKKQVRNMMKHIVKANSIYIGKGCKQSDYNERRRHQTKAIACVQAIVEEMFETMEDYPSDLNKTIPILEMADREFDLLKGWRKSENKNDPSLGKV